MQELAREIVDNGKHAAAQHDTEPQSYHERSQTCSPPTGKITNLCG